MVQFEKVCCQFLDAPVVRVVIGRRDEALLKGGEILHYDTLHMECAETLRDYLGGHWVMNRADFQTNGVPFGFQDGRD
ncbi:hypothetical protein ACFC1L_39955 [Streptomyces sp. NPDC056210]|uniref:hypothetical protein n=1 Tax=Streptomyces sp. NPDC056210 TaxID=3345746 RepID=UPI0035D852C8